MLLNLLMHDGDLLFEIFLIGVVHVEGEKLTVVAQLFANFHEFFIMTIEFLIHSFIATFILIFC